MSGTMKSTPHTPKITGGIPDNKFTKGVNVRLIFAGAYSTIYNEVNRHKGRAIMIAMPVTQSVPIM